MKQHQWHNVYRRWLDERSTVIDTIVYADVDRFVGQQNGYEYIGPTRTLALADLPRIL